MLLIFGVMLEEGEGHENAVRNPVKCFFGKLCAVMWVGWMRSLTPSPVNECHADIDIVFTLKKGSMTYVCICSHCVAEYPTALKKIYERGGGVVCFFYLD